METRVLKILVSLGVPGVSLGVLFLLLRNFNFEFDRVPGGLAGAIALLLILAVAGVVGLSLWLYTPNREQVSIASTSTDGSNADPQEKRWRDLVAEELDTSKTRQANELATVQADRSDHSLERKFDAYLAYTKPDQKRVTTLAMKLKADGVKVWFDSWEIAPGDNMVQKVFVGLLETSCLMLFLSTEALEKHADNLNRIVNQFFTLQGNGKRLIPVLLDECQHLVPMQIRSFRFVKMIGRLSQLKYRELVEVCKLAQPLSTQSPKRRRGSLIIVMEVPVEKCDESVIDMWVNLCRTRGGDAQMRIRSISDGSIRIVLAGDLEACEEIKRLHSRQELSQLFGVGIRSLALVGEPDFFPYQPQSTGSGRICLLSAFIGWQSLAQEASEVLGAVTHELSNCAIYLTTPDGKHLYAQTNYQINGVDFPAKFFTNHTDKLLEISAILVNGGQDLQSTMEKIRNAHTMEICYYINSSALVGSDGRIQFDLQGAQNVIFV